MIAIFALVFLMGKNATVVLFALISFLALREFITLTPTKRGGVSATALTIFSQCRSRARLPPADPRIPILNGNHLPPTPEAA